MNNHISKIVIIAGGMPPNKVMKADIFIGVDRGALWLIKQGITPDIAIGDFDSVTKSEKRIIHDTAKKYVEYSPKKDATDLELAINEVILLRPSEVTIYGALGGRFDHEMGAIQMLLKLESHNILGQIVDNLNQIMIVRRNITIGKDRKYRYVSVIPYGSNASVTLEGFKYNVTNTVFTADSSLGISNEILRKNAIITVHKGLIILVQSSDY